MTDAWLDSLWVIVVIMPRFDDGPSEDFSQREDPDPSDQDQEDDDATAIYDCPHCGRSIYEAAEFCHHCGKYISQEDAPARQPAWYSFGVVLCIVVIVLTAL